MDRIYHHWEKWECYKAGFYSTRAPYPMTPDDAKAEYAVFLSDIDRFSRAIDDVFEKWPNSCEQFLSNENINRIAWIGQASMCIETGVPSHFKGGFRLLSRERQGLANACAREKLNQWLLRYEEDRAVHKDMGTMRLF